jgi:hypothetical protein
MGTGRLSHGHGRALRHYQVDGKTHQLCGQQGNEFDCVVAIAKFDVKVLAFDPPKFGNTGAERLYIGSQTRRALGCEPPNVRNLGSWLGIDRKMPGSGSDECRYELSTSHMRAAD